MFTSPAYTGAAVVLRHFVGHFHGGTGLTV